MKKFMFIYYGGNGHQDMTQEEKDKMMKDWVAWYKAIDDKIADGGNPFNCDDAKAVMASETKTIPKDMWPAKGYTVVNAKDMDEAVDIAKGCPMIVSDEKDATVRVYETMPM